MTQTNNLDNSKAVQVVDRTTGEVMQSDESVSSSDIIPQSSGLARLLDQDAVASGLPVHEYYLQQLSDELREEMANIYYGMVPVQLKGSHFIGKDIPVYGLCIYQHGPYQGKDGFFHPEGFYQVWLLTVDEAAKDEPFVVLKTSATAIAFHAANIVARRGWFLFPEGPITYHVMQGPNGDLHLFNKEHSLKKLVKKGTNK